MLGLFRRVRLEQDKPRYARLGLVSALYSMLFQVTLLGQVRRS
jgi:hypothetical protein